MNIIETQNLVRRFGRAEAVHDLTLHVPEGSIFALLGPNGAGKTTTIKILMNLILPTSGTAKILGVDSRKLGPQQLAQIGYVSENQKLPVWMTIRQFLDYCRPFYPTWDMQLEKTLLEKFELPEDRKLKNLSRGMLMKASLLSALAFRPRLLVLDEPFSGLDPLVRDEVVQGIIDVSNLGGWTVFVSSHDIEEVERLADHVGLIEGGRTHLIEPTETLQNRFKRIEVNLAGEPTKETRPSPTWLLYEQAGHRVGFIESQYVPGATEAKCSQHFATSEISVTPISLREIFITIARANRKQVKGAAA